MKYSREIESKYVVRGYGLTELHKTIMALPFVDKLRSLEQCRTTDFYFPAAEGTSVRLRDSWGIDHEGFSKQLKEITVKKKDQGSNYNRLEENVEIDNCAIGFKALSVLLGSPVLKLTKDERVLWTTDGMVISLCNVNEDTDKIFLEVEGPSEELVETYSRLFRALFEMAVETRSLMEIYSEVHK